MTDELKTLAYLAQAMEKGVEFSEEICDDLESLLYMFSWYDSDEGEDFWYKVYTRQITDIP